MTNLMNQPDPQPYRLCGGMVHAIEIGYLETRSLFNMDTNQHSPYLYGFPGRGKGRKREQFVFIHFCPWCGGKQDMMARTQLQCAAPLRMEMDGKVWEPVGFEPEPVAELEEAG